jgi:hypothetical protein
MISGVLAGGTRENLPLDLKPGRYALLCFASDRAGGPHTSLRECSTRSPSRAQTLAVAGTSASTVAASTLSGWMLPAWTTGEIILTVGNVIS